MNTELVQALSEISSDGLVAVMWYSTMQGLPKLIFTISAIFGVRAAWKYFKESEESNDNKEGGEQ